MEENEYFPPGAFNFSVVIDGLGDADARFQEVQGLTMEIVFKSEAAEKNPAGQTDTRNQTPDWTRYSNLVLKRGLVAPGSELSKWCMSCIKDVTNITKKNLSVNLLDAEGKEVLMSWSFVQAYPVKWAIESFNAQQNGIATESMEFVYDSFEVKDLL